MKLFVKKEKIGKFSFKKHVKSLGHSSLFHPGVRRQFALKIKKEKKKKWKLFKSRFEIVLVLQFVSNTYLGT